MYQVYGLEDSVLLDVIFPQVELHIQCNTSQNSSMLIFALQVDELMLNS